MAGGVQQLYLVYGGALVGAAGNDDADPRRLGVRGIFDSYETAYEEWKSASFRTGSYRLRAVLGLGLFLLLVLAAPGWARMPDGMMLEYQILRRGKDIGRHRV